MITVLVTKMDHFNVSGAWPSTESVEEGIRTIFKDEVGVDRVMFSHPNMDTNLLSSAIFDQVKDTPARVIRYSNDEMLQHFGITTATCRNRKHLFRNEEGIEATYGKRGSSQSDLNSRRMRRRTRKEHLDIGNTISDNVSVSLPHAPHSLEISNVNSHKHSIPDEQRAEEVMA